MTIENHLKYNPTIDGNSLPQVGFTKARQSVGFAFVMNKDTNPLLVHPKFEVWRKIYGFPEYFVSSHGRIRSYKNGKQTILNCNKTVDGYLDITLLCGENKRRAKVHRLVAEHFISNPMDKPEVNHINGQTRDNRVANLEWVTGSENMYHAYRELGRKGAQTGRFGSEHNQSKPVVKLDLEGNYIQEYASISETNMTVPHYVSKCCNGKASAYKGFKWMWKQDFEKQFKTI